METLSGRLRTGHGQPGKGVTTTFGTASGRILETGFAVAAQLRLGMLREVQGAHLPGSLTSVWEA